MSIYPKPQVTSSTPVKETQSIKSSTELKHSVTLKIVLVAILLWFLCVCYWGRSMPILYEYMNVQPQMRN